MTYTPREVRFGGTLIPNCQPIRRIPFVITNSEMLASGTVSVQTSGQVNWRWKLLFSAPTEAEILAIYLKGARQALVIDGQTYNYCTITAMDDIEEGESGNDWWGGIEVTQETATFSSSIIQNGEFETGDLEGWSDSGTGLAGASYLATYQGSYGCLMTTRATAYSAYAQITQVVNWSTAAYLRLWARVINPSGKTGFVIEVYEGTRVIKTIPITGSYWEIYDVIAIYHTYPGGGEIYNEDLTIKLTSTNPDVGSDVQVRIDDVELCDGFGVSLGLVTNPSFETGDLTGWTASGSNGTAAWTGTDSHTGTYAATLTTTPPAPSTISETVSQTVDVTNVNSITFYASVIEATSPFTTFTVSVGGTVVQTLTATSGWTQYTIDVSDLTGSQLLEFKVESSNSPGSEITVYIDNVEAFELNS